MSKGLEKLKTIRHIHDMECGEDERINKDFDIIKQELEEKETQDDYIKMLEDRIDNLETSYLRNKKALEIIKNKKVDIHTLYRDSDIIGDTFDYYNNSMLLNRGKQYELTQEEYDLLKEVVNNGR